MTCHLSTNKLRLLKKVLQILKLSYVRPAGSNSEVQVEEAEILQEAGIETIVGISSTNDIQDTAKDLMEIQTEVIFIQLKQYHCWC